MSELSLHIPGIAGRTYAVLGLGRSGAATAETLIRSGARVLAWDDSDTARAAVPADILIDLKTIDFTQVDALVMSPGIPLTHPTPHPVAAAAKAAGKPIISDIELLAQAQPQARFVCITGTNGKSTTTTLIAHVLKAAGRRVEVGGNLGQAALASRRSGSTASTCWNSPPISSTSRRRRSPTLPCCSTSRRIISIVMAGWRAISRPRN